MNTKAIILASGVTLLFFGAYALYYKREQGEPGEIGGDAPDYAPVSSVPGTRNFTLSEFACHDGTPVPAEYYGNLQVLMDNLQVLRDDIGRPVIVTSGYRTPSWNAKVGGEDHSFHLKAMAADIRVPTMSAMSVHARIENLIASGKMMQGGLGSYPTFTHYDVRGYAARWNG